MAYKLKCKVCGKYFLSMNKDYKACNECFVKSGLIEIIDEMFNNGEIEGIESIKIWSDGQESPCKNCPNNKGQFGACLCTLGGPKIT